MRSYTYLASLILVLAVAWAESYSEEDEQAHTSVQASTAEGSTPSSDVPVDAYDPQDSVSSSLLFDAAASATLFEPTLTELTASQAVSYETVTPSVDGAADQASPSDSITEMDHLQEQDADSQTVESVKSDHIKPADLYSFVGFIPFALYPHRMMMHEYARSNKRKRIVYERVQIFVVIVRWLVVVLQVVMSLWWHYLELRGNSSIFLRWSVGMFSFVGCTLLISSFYNLVLIYLGSETASASDDVQLVDMGRQQIQAPQAVTNQRR